MFNLRWHFNRKGQYSGQSINPGPFGYLVFLPALIAGLILPFIGPILAWAVWRFKLVKHYILWAIIVFLGWLATLDMIFNG